MLKERVRQTGFYEQLYDPTDEALRHFGSQLDPDMVLGRAFTTLQKLNNLDIRNLFLEACNLPTIEERVQGWQKVDGALRTAGIRTLAEAVDLSDVIHLILRNGRGIPGIWDEDPVAPMRLGLLRLDSLDIGENNNLLKLNGPEITLGHIKYGTAIPVACPTYGDTTPCKVGDLTSHLGTPDSLSVIPLFPRIEL